MQSPIPLLVDSISRPARDVLSVTFVSATGAELPAWGAGAHIDIVLPSGVIRQYSLCGDPKDARRYRIAILGQPTGRGGSMEAHRALVSGTPVKAFGPRNHFPLVDAKRYVFVAGGIGITPILTLVQAAHARGFDWRLYYGGRSREHMAFVDELLALSAENISLVPQDQQGLLNLDAIIAAAKDAALYCCGPEPLLVALQQLCSTHGKSLHYERFQATQPAADASNEPFEVTLLRAKKTVTVQPTDSMLDALLNAGVDLPWSCREGMCGTCIVDVVSGQIEHRDDFLSESERRENNKMMACVSRGRGRLVVDL
jgi:tetrachlorobenzoquinone reductase